MALRDESVAVQKTLPVRRFAPTRIQRQPHARQLKNLILGQGESFENGVAAPPWLAVLLAW